MPQSVNLGFYIFQSKQIYENRHIYLPILTNMHESADISAVSVIINLIRPELKSGVWVKLPELRHDLSSKVSRA